MLTVAEAIDAILAEAQPLAPMTCPLEAAQGLVLVEDAVADLDSPPFDKALMDGYAVRSVDVPDGRGRLQVVGEILAGQFSHRGVGPGEAIRIMTGAPFPEGADAVVPVEHTRLTEGAVASLVEIATGPVAPGRNRLSRGVSVRAGDCVIPAGRMLRPQELGCLAELGKHRVPVYPRPSAAILATGDELVPVEARPGPAQIRNSNETMLVAQLRGMGADSVPLGIVRDNPSDLKQKIHAGLAYDLLLLSGGVSAGAADFVPAVLKELGVRQVFHKVRIKPGQPLWFGVFEHAEDRNLITRESSAQLPCSSPLTPHPLPHGTRRPFRTYVFGLPGNPVSSMVCCELFARTTIRRLMGMEPAMPVPISARLSCEHKNHGNRPTYHPSRLDWSTTGAIVTPVPWIGSADLSATIEANALALFPEGDRLYPDGSVIDVFPWSMCFTVRESRAQAQLQ